MNDLLGYISRSSRVLGPENDSSLPHSGQIDLSEPATVALYSELPTRHTATRSIKDEDKFDVSTQIKTTTLQYTNLSPHLIKTP